MTIGNILVEAGFYLGKKITVSTKVDNAKWVNMISLSQKGLAGHGEEWQATLKIRGAQAKEEQFPSWTLVKIVDLNVIPFFSSFDQGVEKLKDKLASIYYYYTHGSMMQVNMIFHRKRILK